MKEFTSKTRLFIPPMSPQKACHPVAKRGISKSFNSIRFDIFLVPENPFFEGNVEL
jgi:hypothetical protein